MTLTISGIGIANNSGITQNFMTATDPVGNGGTIVFSNSATAGNHVNILMFGGGENGGTGGSLTKIGSGTLVLTGANTYTGSTNVNPGVLQVDGSINSNTSVHDRGALAGTGTIYGNVTNTKGWQGRSGRCAGRANRRP